MQGRVPTLLSYFKRAKMLDFPPKPFMQPQLERKDSTFHSKSGIQKIREKNSQLLFLSIRQRSTFSALNEQASLSSPANTEACKFLSENGFP